mgnify:CR=1 FL=1
MVRTLADAATRMSRPLARTARPIHTHLALLGHDPASQLLARAQAWHVRRSLRGRAAALPVLSVASPGRAGGRSGPDNFTDIPPGPLATLALSDLCPWTNRLCAIEASGADLADWLERAASIFRRIVPGGADQPLIVQYARSVAGFVTGDFGSSVASGAAVSCARSSGELTR